MKLGHISLVARDADRLAGFYRTVFGCTDIRARRRLSGAQVSRGNGLPGVAIQAIWLSLPGSDGPFLEIFQYDILQDRPAPAVNQPGWGHIAFEIPDIHATARAVLTAGGAALGQIADLGTAQAPVLCVYMRDPEGNIVELEQG